MVCFVSPLEVGQKKNERSLEGAASSQTPVAQTPAMDPFRVHTLDMSSLPFSVPLDKLLIGNEFVSSKSSNLMLDVINPADENVIAQVPNAGTNRLKFAVMTCRTCQETSLASVCQMHLMSTQRWLLLAHASRVNSGRSGSFEDVNFKCLWEPHFHNHI